MARNQETPSDDPFYRRGRPSRSSFADDALPLDAGLTEDDGEEEPQQFRRASKRVPVRRGALPRKMASQVRNGLVLLLLLVVLGAVVYEAHAFGLRSARFRVGENGIELGGEAPNSRGAVLEKMHEMIGRNVFQITLAERKRELEKIPWVEKATVIRLWPNHLRVMVKERTPVAFVAIGDHIDLIDAQGVLMEIPPGVRSDYSFPVIVGMNENEPLSSRVPRMKIFLRLMSELDGDGAQAKAHYSRDLDEVDLSDPEDVKVLAKGGSGPIELHLGNESFLQRYMVFLSNVQKWEQERGKLESVDLRYGREVILNPDMHAAPPQAAAEAAKPAAAKQNTQTNQHPKPQPAKLNQNKKRK